MTKRLTISMIALGLLTFCLPAHAFTIEQHVLDTNADFSSEVPISQTFVWPYQPADLSSITVTGRALNGAGSSVSIGINTVTASSSDYLCGSTPIFWPNSDPQFFTYTFSGCTLDNAHIYAFTIQQGGTSQSLRTYGDSMNGYADGYALTLSSYGLASSTPRGDVLDLYFDITVGSGSNLVDFYRRNASIPDFNNWILDFAVPTTSWSDAIANWKVGVDYTFNSSTYYDYGYFTTSSLTAGYAGIPKPTTFASGTLVTAYAYIKNGYTNAIMGSSSVYTFYVTSGEKSDYSAWQSPISTTSPIVSGSTCDSTNGWFDKTVCYTLNGLFAPSDASLSRLMAIKEEVQNKPPFGYITIYTNAMNGLSTSTATSTLDLSEMANLSILAVIRTGLTWFLYLVFGIWVIKRLSNFSLMG